jgi:GT2 family glycosyltransferase
VIGAVLLRFNGDPLLLEHAVASLIESHVDTNSEFRLDDVLLVDNASTIDPGAVDRVAATMNERAGDGRELVRTLHRRNNDGFATGVNEGIASLRATCDMVLLLNDDARVGPGAIHEMAKALRAADPSVLSVAPKMLMVGEHGLIDSVGMAVNRVGEAKNIGLGQVDLGQFDQQRDIFGACFGAALFRRHAFDRSVVGSLREDYFMYYEDVEWNWRAQRLGYRCVAVPTAVVWHQMSASSRSSGQTGGVALQVDIAEAERSYERKHRCIERNLLMTGTELLPARDAIRLWTYRWPRLVKGGVTGRFPRASILAAFDAVRRVPRTLQRRREIAASTATDASAVFAFWTAEPIFFDPVTYAPQRSWNALAVAARLGGHEELSLACSAHDLAQSASAASRLPPHYASRVTSYLAELTAH